LTAQIHYIQPWNPRAQRDGQQLGILDRCGPVTEQTLSGTVLFWQPDGQFHKRL